MIPGLKAIPTLTEVSVNKNLTVHNLIKSTTSVSLTNKNDMSAQGNQYQNVTSTNEKEKGSGVALRRVGMHTFCMF